MTTLDDRPSTAGAGPPAIPEQPLRVMLAEDDEDHAELIGGAMTASPLRGFTVERAADGAEALLLATNGLYDALVLDYGLGDMDGLTLLERLRSAGVTTPAVLLTSGGSEEVAARALRAGADEYLPKLEGLKDDALRRAVVAMVGRRRVATELAGARDYAARAEAALATGRAVAHDLASPLTVVMGMAELLLRRDYGVNPAGRLLMEEMYREALSASELLKSLSSISIYAETASPAGPLLDIELATRRR